MKKINIIYECSDINDPDSLIYEVIGRVLIRTNTLNEIIEEAVRLIPIAARNCELDMIKAKVTSIDMLLGKYNPFIRIESAKLQYQDVDSMLDYFINAMTAGTGDYYRMASVDEINVNFTEGSIMVTGRCYDFN